MPKDLKTKRPNDPRTKRYQKTKSWLAFVPLYKAWRSARVALQSAAPGLKPVTKEPWNHAGEVGRYVPSYGLDGELIPSPTEKPPMTKLASTAPRKSFAQLDAASTVTLRGKRRPRLRSGAR